MNALRSGITATAFLLAMTLLSGLAYPLAVTGLAALLFSRQAAGSLLVVDGEIRGSRLLAQDFSAPGLFLARPSAGAWSTLPSSASNLAASNPALAVARDSRRAAWEAAAPGVAPPDDMLTASGSGLDPDLSLEAALGQVDRVGDERALSPAAREALVRRIRELARKATTLLGPPRVNVVDLNALLLDDPTFAQGK